jgi:hypothetical protein
LLQSFAFDPPFRDFGGFRDYWRSEGLTVGQSFIRSYARLTQVTDESHVVLSYVGVTKAGDRARRIPAAGRKMPPVKHGRNW